MIKLGKLITVTVPRNRIMPGSMLFKLHDTHGLPLETSVCLTMERKMFIDWRDYFLAAIKAGWTPRNALNKAIASCRENCYGGDYLRRNFKVKESI